VSFGNNRVLLNGIASKINLQEFQNGENIFEEGDIGDKFYVVLEGEVSIYKRQQFGDEFYYQDVVLVKLFRGQVSMNIYNKSIFFIFYRFNRHLVKQLWRIPLD
jgi:CRP-like cAMP-binding protein